MDHRSVPARAIALALVTALTACAANAPVSSPSASPPAAPAAVVASAPAEQRAEFPGFKRVVRDGEEYFCQTRRVTGSRARVAEICLNRDQMRRMQEVNEEYRNQAAIAGSQGTLTLDSPTQ